MKNKQHEYILKAFLETKIPEGIRQYAPQLLDIDSAIGGYCTQLLKAKDSILILSDEIISVNEKKIYSQIINESTGNPKDEIVMYYRLAIITESILYQYQRKAE